MNTVTYHVQLLDGLDVDRAESGLRGSFLGVDIRVRNCSNGRVEVTMLNVAEDEIPAIRQAIQDLGMTILN